MTAQEAKLRPESESALRSFLDQACKDIDSVIDENVRARLPEATQVAVSILTELQINQDLLSNKNPDGIIRATLALYLADKWNTNQSNFKSLEALSKSFLTLFQKKDRAYTEDQEPGVMGALTDATLKIILHSAFPEKELNWNTNSTSEIMQQLATDSVIRLPFTCSTDDINQSFEDTPAGQFLSLVYTQNNISVTDRKLFKGMYHQESQVIVLWADSPQRIEVHEHTHASHPGLLTGDFGHVLNEAITELLTFFQLRKDGDNTESYDELRTSSSYRYELSILNLIAQENPAVLATLYQYYDHPSLETARLLTQQLINTIGFDLFGKIYTLRPGDPAIKNLFVELIKMTLQYPNN